MKETRQIIIMRTDLDMPIGKMISQGAHASEGAITKQENSSENMTMKRFQLLKDWKQTGKTKIVLGINSLVKLLNIIEKAESIGINTYVVTDEGRTHFDEPTITCACLGIDTKENLDKVTKRLRLL